DKAEQLMEIYRQLALFAVELLEIPAEPVREGPVEVGNALTILPPRDGCTAFTRIVGNGHGKSLVLRSGPKCGLAEPRVADYRHPLAVHITIRFHVIHHLGERPCPDTDGTPAAVITLYTRLPGKPAVETIVHRVDVGPVELQ